jgi:hypothetical protein
LQNTNQINGDNLQNLRRETSKIFRNKEREYLKGKINELLANNKNENIKDLYRDINELWKDTNPELMLKKDENHNVLADTQNILNSWKKLFNHMLNIHGVHDVSQMDIHTAEPLVSEPSLVEVEIATGKLKSYKSTGTDQIPAELIEAGAETYSEIHNLIYSIWNKEELPQQWKESIIVPVHKNGDKTDCNNYRGFYLLTTAYKTLFKILLATLTPYVNEVIVYHHSGGFRRNRLTMDQVFYIW